MTDRAASMRDIFDQGFAAPPTDAASAAVALLGFGWGQEACALRLTELAGVVPLRRLTALPGGPAAWMGLIGHRGRMVPVYDAAALLGLAPGAAQARWLAITRGDAPVGLAFERLDGLILAQPDAFRPAQPASPALAEVVAVGGVLRGVVNAPALIDIIKRLAGDAGGQEEPLS